MMHEQCSARHLAHTHTVITLSLGRGCVAVITLSLPGGQGHRSMQDDHATPQLSQAAKSPPHL